MWFHIAVELDCIVVDGQQERERLVDVDIDYIGVVGVVDVAEQLVQELDDGLGQANDHHLGIQDCSNVHHMNHHRIDLMYHIDRHNFFEIELVDIVAERLEELAVVVLVVQLAGGRLWLGICK